MLLVSEDYRVPMMNAYYGVSLVDEDYKVSLVNVYYGVPFEGCILCSHKYVITAPTYIRCTCKVGLNTNIKSKI